ncbi:hypothetical protein V8C34DRAFT_250956 [Trichoderma compactum]
MAVGHLIFSSPAAAVESSRPPWASASASTTCAALDTRILVLTIGCEPSRGQWRLVLTLQTMPFRVVSSLPRRYSLHCLEPLLDCCHSRCSNRGFTLGDGDYSERLVKCSGGLKRPGGRVWDSLGETVTHGIKPRQHGVKGTMANGPDSPALRLLAPFSS